jgi:hypothetical protein
VLFGEPPQRFDDRRPRQAGSRGPLDLREALGSGAGLGGLEPALEHDQLRRGVPAALGRAETVAGDAENPGPAARDVAQLGGVAEGLGVRVLDQVLGVVLVARERQAAL